MKTTEEKAKKYDEALNWMRELYPGLHGATKEDAKHYFPELKESEDERMLGAIRLALTDVPEERFTTEGTSLSKVLAWLEKQKKQKPHLELKAGKWYICHRAFCARADHLTVKEGERFQCEKDGIVKGFVIKEPEKYFKECGAPAPMEDEQKEQKPAWSEEDEKMRNLTIEWAETMSGQLSFVDMVSTDFRKIIAWLKSLQPQQKVEWSEDDETRLTNILIMLKEYVIHHYSKDDVDKSVNWLENRVKSFRPQSKVEWSEEDKQNYKVIYSIIHGTYVIETQEMQDKLLSWLKSLKPQSKQEQKESSDKSEISDGYHTFNELYYYRLLYNAAFFNLLPKEWVHKSKRHHDGKECFGGGWFIVMANLPTGQIANHYEIKDWDLFHIPEKETADKWDGHTPQEAAERLHKFLLEMPKQKPEAKLTGWIARDKEFNSYYGTGLILFNGKPRRTDNCWNGDIVMQLPWQIFPDLKWVDEPIEVEITITKK